ncbi:MAG: hypothetical protein IJ628_01215 [Bacteroidaceae bacterium]|nr:hypothetical protein [Bacteroidaceae bacterium]
MVTTYKQPIKEKSRKAIWQHAVESLTVNRSESRILNTNYLNNLKDFVAGKAGQSIPSVEWSNYLKYIDITYGGKKPEELKVAFFCGPEPENDVEVLLSLGIRQENMFAFELDKGEFARAVTALRGKYPQMKLYHGKIEDFALMHNTLFDIVYLDFTSSLLSCYKTICCVLDNNMLAPLGVLAVNTTYMDKTDDNVNFLTNYFYYDVFYEGCVYHGGDYGKTDSGFPTFGRVEGSSCMNWDSPDDLRPFIEKNFECAYSAFQTDFINGYANITKPAYAVMSKTITQRRLLKVEMIKDLLKYDKAYTQMDFDYFNDGINLFSMKFRLLPCSDMPQFFNTTEKGRSLSRMDSLKIWEMLTNSHYIKDYDLGNEIGVDEKGTPIYEKIDIPSFLAEPLEHSIRIIEDALKLGNQRVYFCDVPMVHLWYEMIINSLGYPYHTNVKNHRRHCYTAKARKMCVDVFTFDQCRGFYDWLPMIEYQSDYVEDFDKQMMVRMSLDVIAKHSLAIIEQQYYGSAVAGLGDADWVKYYEFAFRDEIV